MIEAYVAVVTTAIVLPLGVYLGAAWERERAELRRPLAPHEVLAKLRPLPELSDPSLTERVGKGPA